jgi:hypothetical protein
MLLLLLNMLFVLLLLLLLLTAGADARLEQLARLVVFGQDDDFRVLGRRSLKFSGARRDGGKPR